MELISGIWLAGIIIGAVLHDEPKTTVVLGDTGEKKNAVVIKSQKGEVVLDKPYQVASISGDKKLVVEKSLSKEEIEKKFKYVSEALPEKPAQILLYFKSGGSELTDDSKAKLPEILEAIKKRVPCDVNIIGHADRQGSDEVNIKISLQRAKLINKWLVEEQKKQDIKINSIKVESYGENDPLIKTADGVAEAKNRRVEVMVR